MSGDSSQRVARQRPDLPDFRIPEHGHTHPRNGGALAVDLLGGGGSGGGGSGSGGAVFEIRDGSTIVNPATILDFTSGAVVTDLGGGLAGVAIGPYVFPINGGLETITAHGNLGATATFFSTGTGNVHTGTLNANCTFTFAAVTSGKACSFTMLLTQDGTGSRTVTWPGSVVWQSGAPTLATAAASVDILTFFTLDGGATWFGFHVGAGVSGGTPAVTLSTTNSAGVATTALLTDATIAVFDATVPVTQAFGDAAATGSAAKTARRDHVHGMPSLASVVSDTGAHVHVTGDAFNGDGATTVFFTSNGYQPGTIAAYVAGSRTAVTETAPDKVTFSVAPTTGTENVLFDYLGAF